MSFLDNKSLIQYIPRDEPDKCGYCNNPTGSRKYGMWAFQLTATDYQGLIDRGWRRSGHYCYKPILPESCCCLYTIRCLSTMFKMTRSQKRNLKRMNVYLKSGQKPRSSSGPSHLGTMDIAGLRDLKYAKGVQVTDEVIQLGIALPKEDDLQKVSQVPSSAVVDPVPKNSMKPNDFSGKNTLKAKQRRIRRKFEKLQARGLSDAEISVKMVEKKRYPVSKTVESLLGDIDNGLHKLEVRLVRSSPPSQEFLSTFDESFKVFCAYQMAIHKDKPSSLSRKSFERFLVQSPLLSDGDYGSFHQQYWLDGKLIAVGVIDVLPLCVSSVYLFYDPDYSFLSLGTYSALRELALARSLSKIHPQLTYYYMGFYINTCPKMKYKGSYKPSFLLCPEAYSWHAIEECLPKIEEEKYSRFSDEADRDEDANESLDQALVVYKKSIRYSCDVPKHVLEANDYTIYLSTVGSKCAGTMIAQL